MSLDAMINSTTKNVRYVEVRKAAQKMVHKANSGGQFLQCPEIGFPDFSFCHNLVKYKMKLSDETPEI